MKAFKAATQQTMKINSREFLVAEVAGRYNDLLRPTDYKTLVAAAGFPEFLSRLSHFQPKAALLPSRTELKELLFSELRAEINEFLARLPENTEETLQSALQQLSSNFERPEPDNSKNNSKNANDVSYKITGAKTKESNCNRLHKHLGLVDRMLLAEQKIPEAEKSIRIADSTVRINCGPQESKRIPVSDVQRANNNYSATDYFEILHRAACELAKEYASSFDHFNEISCIYGYLRLKEIEVRNLLWIAAMIGEEPEHALQEALVMFDEDS